MLLDIKKAEKLYYVIAKDQYLFSDDAVKYYKLTVALDRLKDTVKILNGIKLNGRWNENAVNFVLWINYADLLVACIDEIAKSFSIGITYEQNIFWGYHGLANKTFMFNILSHLSSILMSNDLPALSFISPYLTVSSFRNPFLWIK